MLVALHGNVLVGVSLGGSVDDLPLAVLCGHRGRELCVSRYRQDVYR